MQKMETNIKVEIGKLKQLQEVDTKIYSFAERQREIPRCLEELRKKLTEGKRRADNLKEEIKHLQVERQDKEVTLQSKEEKIEKLDTQLYQLKSNKEYTSLQTEISGIKADSSLVEEKILLLMDKIDEKNKELAREKILLEKEEKEVNDAEVVLNNENKSIEEELAGLKIQREEMAAQIDNTLVFEYEKIIKGRSGTGIALLNDGICQGCFMKVPPQVVNELQIGNKIVKCQNCSKILCEE